MTQYNLPPEAELIKTQLKSILGQYRVMNASITQRLKAMGFQITKRRTHYKIYYMLDMSRFVVYPSTASEYRTGKILASKTFRYLILPYFLNH